MDEQEWLRCDDPTPMMYSGRATERQFRLFGCACVRRVWHLLTDERSRQAVEVAERFADRLATEEERDAAHGEALDACDDAEEATEEEQGTAVAYAVEAAADAVSANLTDHAAKGVAYAVSYESGNDVDGVQRARVRNSEGAVQCGILRDIIGNPFRPPPPLPPSVLQWNEHA